MGEQIAEHATHIDAAVHRLLTDLRTFDASGAWSRQGARSCAHWLSYRLSLDEGTGREHVRVARALGRLPKIDEVASRGKLSYSQLRAMTRVATPENEEFLLEIAEHSTATQLVLICRKYAAVQRGEVPSPDEDAERRRITKRDLEDGMVSIHATLHPEEAELVWAAVTRIAKEREPGEFSRVDALVEMAEQVVRGTSPERSPTETIVTIPVQALEGNATNELDQDHLWGQAIMSLERVFSSSPNAVEAERALILIKKILARCDAMRAKSNEQTDCRALAERDRQRRAPQ